MSYKFRAGDIVLHLPTNEERLLAVDEFEGRVAWCGYPEGMAEASDCSLVKPATPEERTRMLKTWASSTLRGDLRHREAIRQLEKEPA